MKWIVKAYDPVDWLSPDELDTLIDSWADPPYSRSKHLDLAFAAALHRRRRGLPSGKDPIPGCDCEYCTGMAKDHPARVVRLQLRPNRGGHRKQLNVEEARSVPILEVAQRLGLNPVQKGRKWIALCPLHNDHHPSLHLDAEKNLWYCHPCAEGGDGIRLLQRARGISFPEAVRELAA